ncbi:unnamed protein product [Ceutorhynchus assimilis]|uniref:Uncharacterized protein n=1 Tax=Ceutorhynchus assimilis TaxID=467358 RepID=A0A9N9MFS8_9CUCU|nr:unnamed protein product [Ceutorhynchus assimilis]
MKMKSKNEKSYEASELGLNVNTQNMFCKYVAADNIFKHSVHKEGEMLEAEEITGVLEGIIEDLEVITEVAPMKNRRMKKEIIRHTQLKKK